MVEPASGPRCKHTPTQQRITGLAHPVKITSNQRGAARFHSAPPPRQYANWLLSHANYLQVMSAASGIC